MFYWFSWRRGHLLTWGSCSIAFDSFCRVRRWQVLGARVRQHWAHFPSWSCSWSTLNGPAFSSFLCFICWEYRWGLFCFSVSVSSYLIDGVSVAHFYHAKFVLKVQRVRATTCDVAWPPSSQLLLTFPLPAYSFRILQASQPSFLFSLPHRTVST